MPLAAGPLPGPDDQKPGIFTLGTGIRLQADASIAGGLTEPFTELSLECRIALPLISRSERVHVCKLRPADRNHFTGGVELHRAAPQRNHRPVERQVTVGQLPQIAEHLGLAAMGVKDRMGQEVTCPQQVLRHQRLCG